MGVVAAIVQLLLPGVHATVWLLVALPWLGGDTALLMAGSFIGTSAVLGILPAAFMPVAESELGRADVASQLAYAGQGRDVVETHHQAVREASRTVLGVGAVAAGLALLGADWLGGLAALIKPVTPLVLLGAVGITVVKATRPMRTLMASLICGVVGFVTFSAPGLRSSDWVMTPLLAGLFMVPSAWSLLRSGETVPMADDGVEWLPEPTKGEPAFLGALLGMLTGFLAGIGTGSLVALTRKETDSGSLRYLAVQSAAGLANDCFALVAFALMGTTRSGTAAGLAMAGVNGDAVAALMLVGALAFGVIIGGRVLMRCWRSYRELAGVLPTRWVGAFLLVTGVALTVWKTGVPGLMVMGMAALASSQARKWAVPNQALLTALIGPVLVYQLGWTRPLAALLGLV